MLRTGYIIKILDKCQIVPFRSLSYDVIISIKFIF